MTKDATYRRRVTRNIRRAFALVEDVIAHPEAYPEKFIAIPLDDEVLSRLLSRERLRLLRVLRDEGPFDSVNALAAELGRAQSRVSRDLADLQVAGLVSVERRGKSKRVRATDRPIVLA